MFGKKKPVAKAESFGKLTLSISGMRVTEEYEIINKDDCAEFSHYVHYCASEGMERRLEKRAERPVEEALELLNACGVSGWDGFCGKHPRGVLDGEMFTLEAVINGGRVYASGSQNFPRGVREFRGALYGILNGKE